MALLAYSLRRAFGALVVLLIVIWLIQLAVFQITGPATYIGRGGVVTHYPLFLFPHLRLQLAATSEWRTGALEVGSVLLILLGLGAVWRLWRREAT